MTDSDADRRWLRHAFELAVKAREAGDQPFGAVLVGPDGAILAEGLNTRNVERDIAAHAEMNLVRRAVHILPLDQLAQCTLYASSEPCMMCAGVIAWSGIGTVVFGCSQRRLVGIRGPHPPRFRVPTDLHDLLSGVQPPVTVRGPLLEDEAMHPHEGYWVPRVDLRDGTT
jgi:tRNA(Arg) A34 adenosine deaminase TadA